MQSNSTEIEKKKLKSTNKDKKNSNLTELVQLYLKKRHVGGKTGKKVESM